MTQLKQTLIRLVLALSVLWGATPVAAQDTPQPVGRIAIEGGSIAAGAGIQHAPFAMAIKADTTHQEDFVLPYVQDLRSVIDMDVICSAGLKLGVDPVGGAAHRAEHAFAITFTAGPPHLDKYFRPAG